jgi:glycosyltransferase involved in cell wall biosynthesis
MNDRRRASIVINNYNYESFLRNAIDSALEQSYRNLEIIVVDDGSTDGSREIILAYGDRVRSLLKANEGQTSAINAGFRASRGEVVLFLDADDTLLPRAVEKVLALFAEPDIVKVHWPLWVVTRSGRKTGAVKPPRPLPRGALMGLILREGPDSPAWAPTSGNAWDRRFLQRVLPLPEIERQYGVGSASADAHLSMLAPLFGRVESIREPQGHYRLHGNNDHSAMQFEQRLRRDLALFDYRALVLMEWCQAAGVAADAEEWKRNSWLWQLDRARSDIQMVIPDGARFVLVDDGVLGIAEDGVRSATPFLERNGQYWGPPPDDRTAIEELERLRRSGLGFIVFGWPSFWWFDFYREFYEHLLRTSSRLLNNSRIVVFQLPGGLST